MPLITYDTFLRSERRKSWIYLVDLRETHSLRDVLNDPRIPVSSLIKEIQRFDPPVVASTGKLVSYISREKLFSEHFFFLAYSSQAMASRVEPTGHGLQLLPCSQGCIRSSSRRLGQCGKDRFRINSERGTGSTVATSNYCPWGRYRSSSTFDRYYQD